MLERIKRFWYFPIAYYFRFFAQIQLAFWQPRIVVITGSSGKTTLLHLIESQIGEKARYSHEANSAYGIPFAILGLKRTDLLAHEWLYLFLAAPFRAFKKPCPEKLYIVEADCDRPGEGRFLASLLKPEVTLWVSSGRTHSMNFDRLIAQKQFPTVEQAIAREFARFLDQTTGLAIINGDSELINSQLKRLKIPVKAIKKERLDTYKITAQGTELKINGDRYLFKFLLPEETLYSLAMTKTLLDYLKIKIDPSFSRFQLPPGRSSVFEGLKKTTLIDSSYNAPPDGMRAILKMFRAYPAKVKWAVLGDMLEQGREEQEEHEKLAKLIAGSGLSKIILMGPRISKYTYPQLKSWSENTAEIKKFTLPKEVLDYLVANIKGGEVILFKGARFLEGVIEHLLINKNDRTRLCRRETVWQIRRKKWGL